VTLQTGHVQLPGKILVAFTFVCVEPYGVKVSDIEVIFLDLSFHRENRRLGFSQLKFSKKKKQTLCFLPCYFKFFLL